MNVSLSKNKSISKNSIFYLIYTSLDVIFPFLTGVYVSHVLLETYIGEVEAARNIAQYFLILAYLGIPTYGLREIAKARNDKKELNRVFSELVIINFISTAFFLLIYLFVVATVPVYRNNLPLYIITGGTIALNFLNITWLYTGLEEFSYICYRNLFFKVFCFVLLFFLVRKNEDYLVYSAITVIGVAGNYILNVFNSRKHVSFTFKDLNLKRHLKSIFFLVVVNLAIEIYTLVDITMLKLLASNESIAYYSYGSKIYKIFIHLLNSFTMVVVPRIALYYKENKKDNFNLLLSKTLKVILLISIPMTIGTFFVSDYLIVAIYGTNYIRSAQVLKILSLLFIISPVGYLLGSRVMLVTGQEKKMMIPVVIGAIINIVANYILITSFDEVGAAIASLISEFFVALIYITLSKKEFTLKHFLHDFIKIVVSSLVMALALLLIYFGPGGTDLSKIIKEVFVGVSVYVTSLFVFNESTTKYYYDVVINKLFKTTKPIVS